MTRSGKRLTNWALIGGLGIALAACTTQEPSYYPGYGPYGGYYPYPPSYYYGPGYSSFDYYNGPFFGSRGFSGRSRPSVSQPSPAAPPSSSGGFLGNAQRQASPPASPPPSSGGAQSGGSQPRGFLGNVLRERQNQGQ